MEIVVEGPAATNRRKILTRWSADRVVQATSFLASAAASSVVVAIVILLYLLYLYLYLLYLL